MAASEMSYGEGHSATFTEQPTPTTRSVQFSEIAHHKDGDTNHGFTTETNPHAPDQHDYGPDA